MSELAVESLAAVLRGRQEDLVRQTGAGFDVAQVGAVLLSTPFPIPVPGPTDPVSPRDQEATIETFVADRSGPARAMGDDAALAAWWRPTVDALVAEVLAALEPHGVELADPLYVTVSATPIDGVVDHPHLDDDQYHPAAGVGLVAIAASHQGPRLARGAMACHQAMAGAPLGLDQAAVEGWLESESGGLAEGNAAGTGLGVQHTGPDRIVLFPRFGQLHAGPALAGAPANELDGIRNLLVLRADTVPGR